MKVDDYVLYKGAAWQIYTIYSFDNPSWAVVGLSLYTPSSFHHSISKWCEASENDCIVITKEVADVIASIFKFEHLKLKGEVNVI
jgi:hypothetical protein